MNKLSAAPLAAAIALLPASVNAGKVNINNPNNTSTLIDQAVRTRCEELGAKAMQAVHERQLMFGVAVGSEGLRTKIAAIQNCLEPHVRIACDKLAEEIRAIVLQIALGTGSDQFESHDESAEMGHMAQEGCLDASGVKIEQPNIEQPNYDQIPIFDDPIPNLGPPGKFL